MNWTQRLARNPLWDLGALAIGLLGLARLSIIVPQRAKADDFAHYYIASRITLEGKLPYSTHLDPYYAKYGFALDPTLPFVWLFALYAGLTPRAGFCAWVSTEAVSLIAVLWLTRRLLGERLSARAWRFITAATLFSAATYWQFYYSQVGLSLAAIVLAAYACQRANRHTTACLLVAAAGLLKLFPLVVLPWFVWRSSASMRGRLRCGCLTLLVMAGMVVVTNLGLWRDFFEHGLPVLKLYAKGPTYFNFTVATFFSHLGHAMQAGVPWMAIERGCWLAGIALGMGLVGGAYVLCFTRAGDCESEFCLLSCAMLMGSATAWGHYFVFLIFPMAVAAVRVAVNPSPRRVVWLVTILLLLNYMGTRDSPLLDRHVYLKILVNYLPLYGLLALGYFFARQSRPSGQERHG